MAGGRFIFIGRFAPAAIVAALAAAPAVAAWVHPSVPGSSNSGGQQISTGPPTSVTLSANGSNKVLSATAIASGVSLGTPTTVATRSGAGGSTSQTVTSFSSATAITVKVHLTYTYSYNSDTNFAAAPRSIPASATFTFANLSSAAQSQTVIDGVITITATPNAANNTIVVTYSQAISRSGDPPTNAITLTLTPPPTTMSASSMGPSGTVIAPRPFATPTPIFGDPVAEVLRASSEAQAAIDLCNTNVGTCVADALDAYADKLEVIAPRLPPQLRVLPRVVHEAAAKVRVARTKVEAVKAVKVAIVQVAKAISLLRAEDPNAAPVGVQVGRAVDGVLEAGEIKLLRATEL